MSYALLNFAPAIPDPGILGSALGEGDFRFGFGEGAEATGEHSISEAINGSNIEKRRMRFQHRVNSACNDATCAAVINANNLHPLMKRHSHPLFFGEAMEVIADRSLLGLGSGEVMQIFSENVSVIAGCSSSATRDLADEERSCSLRRVRNADWLFPERRRAIPGFELPVFFRVAQHFFKTSNLRWRGRNRRMPNHLVAAPVVHNLGNVVRFVPSARDVPVPQAPIGVPKSAPIVQEQLSVSGLGRALLIADGLLRDKRTASLGSFMPHNDAGAVLPFARRASVNAT
jgi:hypothetical protein